VVVALLALAACATQQNVGTRQRGAAAFSQRARHVIAQWDQSRAARSWRTGLVLLNRDELTQLPPGAGFADGRQKHAFALGRYRLAAALPAKPLRDHIRWASGATLHLPLMDATTAFATLAAQQPCPGPPCGQLTVTAARPGTVTAQTSRGAARIPAWQFTVAGLSWPVSEVAVAPDAMVTLPSLGGVPAAGRSTPGVESLGAVSADGRTLTLRILTGACTTARGGRSYEGARAVVVGSWQIESGGNCIAVGLMRSVRVTLTRPLGTRVVLDVASGQPLVRGAPPSH